MVLNDFEFEGRNNSQSWNMIFGQSARLMLHESNSRLTFCRPDSRKTIKIIKIFMIYHDDDVETNVNTDRSILELI